MERGTQRINRKIFREVESKGETPRGRWERGMDWVNPETTAQNVIAPPNTRFLLDTGDLSQAPAPTPFQCSLGSKTSPPPHPWSTHIYRWHGWNSGQAVVVVGMAAGTLSRSRAWLALVTHRHPFPHPPPTPGTDPGPGAMLASTLLLWPLTPLQSLRIPRSLSSGLIMIGTVNNNNNNNIIGIPWRHSG